MLRVPSRRKAIADPRLRAARAAALFLTLTLLAQTSAAFFGETDRAPSENWTPRPPESTAGATSLVEANAPAVRAVATVHLRIVDTGGTPVADATILGRTGVSCCVADSNETGDAAVVVPADRAVQLVVAAAGYEFIQRSLAPQYFKAVSEIVIERQRSLRGRVVDPAGEPIPGVEVSISCALSGLRPQERASLMAAIPPPTTTDSRGEFSFAEAPRSLATLRASRPGYLPFEAPPARTNEVARVNDDFGGPGEPTAERATFDVHVVLLPETTR
jgi:hypothetical protein